MSYMPKIIKCKLSLKGATDDEIMKSGVRENEIEMIKQIYRKLEGVTLYLSLWDYDDYESYHLTDWDDDVDDLVMEAIFIIEKEFGIYSNFEEFKRDWKNKEYEPCVSIVFPKDFVEELEVIHEELK